MEKFFNTAGPCNPARHYMLPALDRLPDIRRLVAMEQYFVIHAPRQTGKTTAVKALVREINANGDKVALYCTLESLQGATDPARAASAIASLLWFNASNVMPEVFKRMLDVRDYKAQIRPDGESLGQISPFNIISKDMMLRNFTADEVRELYAQHTAATGQPFAPEVLDLVMELTCGQPWLVNAIARECVEEIHGFRYGETITAANGGTITGNLLQPDTDAACYSDAWLGEAPQEWHNHLPPLTGMGWRASSRIRFQAVQALDGTLSPC